MARRRSTQRGDRIGGELEWVGGRLSAPMYVTEGEPFRPDVVLWFELPEGLIVGMEMVPPTAPAAVIGEVLTRAMQRPAIGSPRRPARVRVSDPRLVEIVAPLLGDRSRVRVAPTPELDEVLAELSQHVARDLEDEAEAASYFEDGRVPEPLVADLFTAAERLYRLAPWQHAPDVLRVDLPHLQVEGACLSIIGSLGESIGFLLFPSLHAFEDFLVSAEQAEAGGPVDLGGACLALNFERGADIPASMRREVSEHGWPVAGPAAYPLVTHRDRDGLPRPLTERDVRIVTAVAGALAAFCARHGTGLAEETFGPVCESYTDAHGDTVHLTLPYEAHDEFDLRDPVEDFAAPPPPARAAPRVGRNDPCPCGSGRKYKKCHLGEPPPAATGGAAAAEPEADPAVDGRHVIGTILEFGLRRFRGEWKRLMRGVGEELVEVLGATWWIFHASIDGRSPAEHFLAAGTDRVPAEARAWIAAQRDAWLSIWEVASVEPGCLRLTDLLTGEQRTVRDHLASQTLRRRDAILARVVERDGVATLWGAAPYPLPPLVAADIVRLVRRRLRVRDTVPVERLREEAVGPYLMRRWQAAIDELFERAAVPPRLQNTAGEALLLTTDHFTVAAGARDEVAHALQTCGAIPTDRAGEFIFQTPAERPGVGGTITATVHLTDAALTVATNSLVRADAHRERIAAACGPRIRHRIREHTDPRGAFAAGGRAPAAAPAPQDRAESARLEREFKDRYYAQWLDESIPALGGKTPRDAVRTAAGRRQVDLLLRDMEHRESRLPADQQMDFAVLRRALGLEP